LNANSGLPFYEKLVFLQLFHEKLLEDSDFAIFCVDFSGKFIKNLSLSIAKSNPELALFEQ